MGDNFDKLIKAGGSYIKAKTAEIWLNIGITIVTLSLIWLLFLSLIKFSKEVI